MNTIGWFKAFMESEAGVLLYAVLAIALLDFVLGTLAAFRDDTFKLDAVAAFLRKHIAGRVAPIAALLVWGYVTSQTAITAVGVAAATAYLLETVGSIRDSWAPGRPAQAVPQD